MNGIVNKGDPIIPLPPPSNRLSVLWLFHGGQLVRNKWSFSYLPRTVFAQRWQNRKIFCCQKECMFVCQDGTIYLKQPCMDAQMYKAFLCNQRPLSSLSHNEAKWVEEWDAMRKKPCLRRKFYNLAHFLSFLLNSDNDTHKFQASGRELGPAINFQFSVFLTFQSSQFFCCLPTGWQLS